MNYEAMTDNELIALSQKVDAAEKDKIDRILAKRPPTQVLTGAGGIESKEGMGKL